MPLIRSPAAPRNRWNLPLFDPVAAFFDENVDPGTNPREVGGAASNHTSAILESYVTAFRGFETGDAAEDDAFLEALDRVHGHLLGDADGVASCLVCLEDVKPAEPTWHCAGDAEAGSPGCYAVLHLQCVQAWARQQLTTTPGGPAAASELMAGDKVARPSCWGCPKCRKEYTAIPTAYRCFCGQSTDPPFNPWNVAHSCGSECRVRDPHCGHECLLLCHPGPHPPCPRVVQTACFCGKLEASKRCGRHDFSCGAPCGRRCPTGHPCIAPCHPGECPRCIRIVLAACRCGAEKNEAQCGRATEFRCTLVCGRPLSCGIHVCDGICCPGDCGKAACPLAGLKTCPCGKTLDAAVQCGMVVPPCGETCDKLLPCGAHRCTERCHLGDCPATCRATVEKPCRCGKTSRAVQCSETFRCERRCERKLGCGKHQCRRRCCDGNCPPCEETCKKWLRCRNHRCPAPCHSGPCAPCPLAATIACACGQTAYQVPCGRESTVLPPPCRSPCIVPPTCRHRGNDSLPPHRCHFGPCPGRPGLPACPLPCGEQLPCGHRCSARACHDPPPPGVTDFAPPPPPLAPGEEPTKRRAEIEAEAAMPPAQRAAAAAAAALEGNEGGILSRCPPCAVLVAMGCLGGHVQLPLLCCQAEPFACAKACGRALPCGHHQCSKRCHDPAVEFCPPCDHPCELPRCCRHPCSTAAGRCHPGDCGACEADVSTPCHCGKTSLQFPCHALPAGKGGSNSSGGGVVVAAEQLCCEKACAKPLPRCPHLCEERCHPGDCPGSKRCSAEVTVRCKCKRVKKKVPCCEVPALLEAAGVALGSRGGYGAETSLRVLSCDKACAAAAKAAKVTLPSAAAAAASIGREGGEQKLEANKKKMLQAEREAERQRREADRDRKLREKAAKERWQVIIQVTLLVVVVGTLVAGGLALWKVLGAVDHAAQKAWKLQQTEL